MIATLTSAAARLRVLCTRLLDRLGMGEDSFLIVLATIVGIITSAAAVGFHYLIEELGELLYASRGADFLYGRGIAFLIVIPAAGGLLVGLIGRYLTRSSGGSHGVGGVIESVIRTSGVLRPRVALEKIVTSGITIGSGGSAGAEGPIVQIGAAISSGVGALFRIARHQMPVLIGCGAAAGISAIFNAPIGGVLFTLEVILFDFSIRTFTPVVVAAVIANVSTKAIMSFIEGDGSVYAAIFARPGFHWPGQTVVDWGQIGNFVLLGIACGVIGATLTRVMQWGDRRFTRLNRLGALKPAIGGALLGCISVAYVIIFGWFMLGEPKPFPFGVYPMPAFGGDGYGVINALLTPDWYTGPLTTGQILALLAFLLVAKILATMLTLSSGGSGGVIAPSLFLGAVGGGLLGMLLKTTGWFPGAQPEVYAVAGMGAVLASVVHAPMAAILIVFELTQDYKVMLATMLTTVIALGVSRLIAPDSIYNFSLRERGIRTGRSADMSLMRRLNVEQVQLEPAAVVLQSDPLQRVIDLMEQTGKGQYVVIDRQGTYVGMIVPEDITLALMRREAVPLMIVGEIIRTNIPLIRNEDDLATVFDIFTRLEVSHLPVQLSTAPGKVIGLITRHGLMKRYAQGLDE